ncbi:TPA: hypothetical protein ACH3X2_012356 [Trebouxia sp. C0005]
MVHRDLRFAPRPDGLRNLGSNIIPTRGSTEEWGNKKPPSMRSSDYHEKLCMQQGGSGSHMVHEEIKATTKIKPSFDIDIPSDSPLERNAMTW